MAIGQFYDLTWILLKLCNVLSRAQYKSIDELFYSPECKLNTVFVQVFLFPKMFFIDFLVTKTLVESRLTLSRRRPLSYRNQSIDLLWKSMDWFLYDNGLLLERVKISF